MATEIDFSGKLSFLNFGELLQLIGSSSATGTLRIFNGHSSEPGVALIEKGNPINATTVPSWAWRRCSRSSAGPMDVSSLPGSRWPGTSCNG